jgi:transposase
MLPIEQETNLEVLRQYAILYRDEAKRLSTENAELKGGKTSEAQDFLHARLKDQLSRLKKKFFGFGREELHATTARPVGHKQQRLRLHGKRPHVEKSQAGKAKKADKTEKVLDQLRERIEHDFTSDRLREENQVREIVVTDPKEAWKKMEGLESQSVEITITERTYKKVVHSQAKYKLKDEYNKTGKEVIITAPGPVKLKPGCQYSVDFALAVVSDKYEFHLPLERQRRKMEASGLDIDVKTLFDLTRTVANHCDEAVIPKIRRDIQSDFCAVHLDESPWPINGSKDSAGQMWVMSNRIGNHYRFEPTRSGKIAVEMLKGYEGAVVTDGFSGYSRLPRELKGVRQGGCWGHARREFFERIDDFSEAADFVEMVDKLYEIEDKALTFEHLAELRRTESKALIDQMHAWLWDVKQRYLKGDGIVAGANYCLKRWKQLTLFLTDLSVPLDNNYAELALRHIVMGRKNFAGSRSIDGADIAATLYTVIESSKKVGLQPTEYMKYVITERWHGRDPKSPLEYSLDKFGKNEETKFPAKKDWQIMPAETPTA